MTTKQLGFKAPVALAITAGATTPNPGSVGVQVWSTVHNRLIWWNGSNWRRNHPGDPIRCRAVAITNQVLASTTTVDGISLVTGDLVLLTAQDEMTSGQYTGNGVYTFNGTGLVRSDLMMLGDTFYMGSLVSVNEGTDSFQTLWMSNNAIKSLCTVGTDSIFWGTFS